MQWTGMLRCLNSRIGEGWQRIEISAGGGLKRRRRKLGCSAIAEENEEKVQLNESIDKIIFN